MRKLREVLRAGFFRAAMPGFRVVRYFAFEIGIGEIVQGDGGRKTKLIRKARE